MKYTLIALLFICSVASGQEKAPAQKAKGSRALLPGHVARLVTLSADGKDLRTVYETDKDIIEAPNWSPDGRWLVFNGNSALWRVPADGSAKPEKIPTGDVKAINNDHLISPDGKTIYFSAGGDLYSVPFEGGTPKRISNQHPEESRLTYWLHGISPDGRTLLYTGARKVNGDPWGLVDIHSIPAAGGPDVNLTKSPAYDDGPEYSPDGQWIYFNSERDAAKRGESQNYRMAESHIYRMRPDGSGVEQLTRDDRVNWFPHLSPDGQWMVYLSFPPLTLGHPADKAIILRRMKPDGGEPTDLIAFNGGQGTINVPSWSPDSKRFAFVMYPPRSPDLPTTLLAQPDQLLLREDFTTYDSSKWKEYAGDWQVIDGALRGAERAQDRHQAATRLAMPLPDFILSMEVKLHGATNISISIDDEKVEHVARVKLSPEAFHVLRDDHDHKGPDQPVVFLQEPVETKTGKWHSIVIEMVGDTMVATLNGKTTGFGTDELFKVQKANPGITVLGVSASFRNLRIWSAKSEPKANWSESRLKLLEAVRNSDGKQPVKAIR